MPGVAHQAFFVRSIDRAAPTTLIKGKDLNLRECQCWEKMGICVTVVTEAMYKHHLRQRWSGGLLMRQIRKEVLRNEGFTTFHVLVYRLVPSGHLCVPSSVAAIGIVVNGLQTIREKDGFYGMKIAP